MMDLDQMISDAIERAKQMAPERRARMLAQQRRSFVRAEVSFGSDADETAYRRAIAQGDEPEIARLEAEASARMDAVDAYFEAPND